MSAAKKKIIKDLIDEYEKQQTILQLDIEYLEEQLASRPDVPTLVKQKRDKQAEESRINHHLVYLRRKHEGEE